MCAIVIIHVVILLLHAALKCNLQASVSFQEVTLKCLLIKMLSCSNILIVLTIPSAQEEEIRHSLGPYSPKDKKLIGELNL